MSAVEAETGLRVGKKETVGVNLLVKKLEALQVEY